MKYLKTYKQINEGLVRSKMLPKPHEEMILSIKNTLGIDDDYIKVKLPEPKDVKKKKTIIKLSDQYNIDIDDYEKDTVLISGNLVDVFIFLQIYLNYASLNKRNFSRFHIHYIKDNIINEGLRDMMKPKSDNDILLGLKELSIGQRLNKVKEYDLDRKFYPSDEQIKKHFKYLYLGDILRFIKEHNLDRKFYPPKEEIEKYLSRFSGEKKLQEIFQLKIYEYLPKKNGYYYIDTDLELDYLNLIELPDNLYIKGSLYCTGNNLIRELPNGLVIEDSLFFMHSNLEKVPNDIKVGKDIKLIVNNITELPDNLVVNGNLEIDYNPINKLPNGLIIKGDLYCVETDLKELPDDLVVSGTVFTAGTAIRNVLKIKKPIGVNKIDVSTRRF